MFRVFKVTPTAVIGLLLTISPAMVFAQSAPAPPPIPGVYQDLYSSLSGYINTFSSQINSGWNHSSWPVVFAANLMTGNSDNGSTLLGSTYFNYGVIPDLNQLQSLGVDAVYVTINFPILYQPYYTWAKSSDYQAYLNFYQQLATAVRARGLKLIVGTSGTLTQGGFIPVDLKPYYSSLTLNQYDIGRSVQAATIAKLIKPDYLSVIGEPDTEAAQTGFGALNTVSGSTTLLNMIMTTIRQFGAPGVTVGAGVGSWVTSYQSWFNSFAGTGIQYLDIHVNPVNKTYLSGLPAMADYAASLGLPVACGQCWLGKERDNEVGVLNYNQVAGRDPFSFWAPLDISFFQSFVSYAAWKHALFISPFWTPYFHAYMPYNATTSATPPVQLISQAENAAVQAIGSGQFTSLATAYGQMITVPADTTAPSVPAGITGVASSSATFLNWTPSTDNLAVAGYTVYRNGAFLATVGIPTYNDFNLPPSTSYTYTITAYDGASNTSAQSAPVTVTTWHN